MADRVETFAVSCTGGLVTNQPTLAQAAQMPGTARELVNFEPSVEGGYRRINGYTKYNSSPMSDMPVVFTTQAYSIGDTAIRVGGWNSFSDLFTSVITFTNGSTTHTVTLITDDPSAPNDSYVTLTFTPALDSNIPARTFINLQGVGLGDFSLFTVDEWAVVFTGYGNIRRFNPLGLNIVSLSLGNHASGIFFYSRVDGAGQTGTTLVIKNLKHRPHYGDSFWIGTSVGSFPSLFTIENVVSYSESTGTATLTIYPSLPTSPANNALIVWFRRTAAMTSSAFQYVKYEKGDTEYVAVPAANDYPLIFDYNYYQPVHQLYDLLQSDDEMIFCAAYYKNHMFWGSASKLYISAPFDEFDYSPANGAGTITISGEITGLIALRNSLIIFCRYSIFRLVGSSIDNFSVEVVTGNTGCIDGYSIQEINGDVMFLSDTGLSRLSDTDQQSGLGISVVSNTIKTEINALVAAPVSGTVFYPSVFIPNKGQYRVFRHHTGTTAANTVAVVGSQVTLNPTEISWSLIQGIKPSSIDYFAVERKVLFINDNGSGQPTYIYEMDSGNTFDGTNITSTYSTPYYHMNDPRVRKAFLNLETTVEPEGAVTITVDTILNYNKSDVIQPPAVVIGTTGTTYGDNTSPSYVTPLIGNGDVVSLKFTSNTNIPPYVIQSFTVEYSTNDRR